MRTFTMQIECDNSAFEESEGAEVARILHSIGEQLRDGDKIGILYDMNGNRVGRFWYQGESNAG